MKYLNIAVAFIFILLSYGPGQCNIGHGTLTVPNPNFFPPLDWILYNNAAPVALNCKECYQLTEEGASQKGCVWDPDPVDFSGPISIQATLYFGDSDAGADGICLVFAPSPGCGEGGGGIGALGIPSAVIIEFDTYDNGPGFGDIPGDHVSLDINGDVAVPILGPSDLGNIEDDMEHTIQFNWDGAGNIEIYFDGVLVLTGSYDLLGALGTNEVYMGFTASTGGAWNNQIVCPGNEQVLPPMPPIFELYDLEVCANEQGVVYSVIPEPNTVYTWYLPPGASQGGSGSSIIINWGEESGEVCVDADNGCGKSDTVCITVEVTPLPEVSVTNPDAFCVEEFNLELLEFLNVQPGEMISFHPSQQAAEQGTPDLGVPPLVWQSGTYWIRVEAGDGCVQLIPVDITLEFPEILVEQSLPLCAPGGVELTLLNVIEASGLALVSFTYHLSQAEALTGSNALQNTFITTSGTYWVRAATEHGCFDVATILVVLLDPPIIEVIPPPVQCAVDSFDLRNVQILELSGLDTSEYTITYHGNSQQAQDGFPSINPPFVYSGGTYWVRITNLAGCFDLVSFTLDFLPSPSVWMDAPDSLCVGDSLKLTFLFGGVGNYQVSYLVGTDTFFFDTNLNPYLSFLPIHSDVEIRIIDFFDQTPAGCPEIIGGPVSVVALQNPVLGNPQITCVNDMYIVQLELLAGDSLSWQVNGNPGNINGNYFISDSIPAGLGYTFQIWDAFGCDTITLSATPNCDCMTDAGSLVEPGANLCPGDTLFLNFSNDGFLEPDDLRQYILYQTSPVVFEDIIAWNDQPVFLFDPAVMQYGVTYYVASIAGNNLGGTIDTTDICLSLGQAIPVTWRNKPMYVLPASDTVCISDPYLLSIPLQGTAPFELVYQIGVNPIVTQVVSGNSFQVPLPTSQNTTLILSQFSDSYCTNSISDTFFLYVNTGPTASGFVFDCNGTNSEFTISFVIQGGDSTSYVVSGGSGILNGNIFTSAPIQTSTNYNFILTDFYDCKPFVVSGNFECKCLSDAGFITGGPINLCLDDTLDFNVFGAYQDGNDTIVWWLVSDTLQPILTRIKQFSDQKITYPGLPVVPGQFYYLIGVVGNAGNIDGIDTADVCLDFSNAVPVRFVLPPLISGISPNPSGVFSCLDTIISITVSASAPANLSYNWSTAGGLFSGSTTINPILTKGPGWYAVTVTESSAGCADTISLYLGQSADIPIIQIAGPPSLTCSTTDIVLDATGSSEGAEFNALWTTTDGAIFQGATTLSPSVNAPGTYFLTILNTTNNCSATGFIVVIQDTLAPMANAGQDVTVACGQPFPPLDGMASIGQGSLTYLWSTTNGLITGSTNTSLVLPASAGEYELVVTDQVNGCTNRDLVLVTNLGGLDVGQVEAFSPLCFGESNGILDIFQIAGGSPPYIGSLSGQQVNMPGSFTNLTGGTYQLTIIDDLGCTWDSTIFLQEPQELTLDLGLDLSVVQGQLVNINPVINGGSGSILLWEWTSGLEVLCSGCTSFAVQPNELQTISLLVEDENGCQANDQIDIQVTIPKYVYIPNSFSPDYDGINDLFTIYGGQNVVGVNRFAVFDRWGNDLYLLEDFPADGAQGWDGEYKGKRMDPGVYVWYAEVVFTDGTVRLYKGDVHLLK
ncbi:MAG: gliding motility-associated C-terminal domain-containing protein [Saprospiraceae bacterium]|nr:gliding motility-associated C-terminal domain-containing protein [Saprospiraceae bacterium]